MVYGCQESAEKEATAHVNAHCAVQGHCFLALCAQLCPCIGQDQCSSDRQCGYKRQLRCRSRSRFTLAQALHSKVLCNLTAGRGVRCTEDWNPWHACRVGEASQPGPSWPVAICEPIELPGDDSVDPVIPPRSLRCTTLSKGTWRWQLAAKPRMFSKEATHPLDALESFPPKHGKRLTLHEREVLEEAILGRRQLLMQSSPVLDSPPDDAHQDMEPGEADVDDLDALPGWRVCDEQQAASLLQRPMHAMVEQEVLTQSHIPKSMVQPMAQSLKWLSQQVINSDLTENQRALAQTIIVRAPVLLWPQPPAHEKRRPYSRVRICKERLHALHEGQWATLFCQNTSMPKSCSRSEPSPDCPDSLFWKRERGALLKAMQHHRVCTAWKRLHSLGILEACELTVAKIAEKWSPQDDPLPDRQAGLSMTALGELYSPETVLQAVSSLHSGVAADAHGWNTETLRQLIGHLSTAWIAEQLQHIQMLDTSHIAWKMVSIYKIVALKKNTAGAVRPIAMPTVWHKLAAHIQVQESGAVIRNLTEPYQYALGASNPAHAMSEAMAARICELEDPVVVQLDVANAYGSLETPLHRHCPQRLWTSPWPTRDAEMECKCPLWTIEAESNCNDVACSDDRSSTRRPSQHLPVRLGTPLGAREVA